MSFNLGVNVVEVEGQIPPSIEPAETSVAGFIIRSKRGVRGKVVAITSWVNFLEHFGDHHPDAIGAYAIAGFFANGGTVAYVTRIVPPTETSGGEDPGEAASEPATAASRVFAVGTTTVTLSAAFRGEDDLGAWGNDIAVRITESEGVFELAVRYPGTQGRDVETFEGLELGDTAGVAARVNGTSKYVKLAFGGTGTATADDFELLGPADAPSGEEGTFEAAEVTAEAIAALPLFETVNIQLLACPETSDADFAEAALTHCENLGDRMFVGHVPLNSGELDEATLSDHVALRADKQYGALYGPDIVVFDPLRNMTKVIPPTGHILGVYARTDRERGIWKAPAGDAARLRGALDVTDRVNDADHTRFVKQLSVNLVRPIPGKGIVIDSARTLSTNTKWLYVNVRLLFNFVKSSLKSGLRWVVGEPNDPNLWGRVEFDTVRPFLLGLWRSGAFGPGTADQVFTIKVDADNNRATDIEQGLLNVELTFYPSRPAETIIVRVGQQLGASTATEA